MEKILTELKSNQQPNKTQEISEDEIKKAKRYFDEIRIYLV